MFIAFFFGMAVQNPNLQYFRPCAYVDIAPQVDDPDNVGHFEFGGHGWHSRLSPKSEGTECRTGTTDLKASFKNKRGSSRAVGVSLKTDGTECRSGTTDLKLRVKNKSNDRKTANFSLCDKAECSNVWLGAAGLCGHFVGHAGNPHFEWGVNPG